MLVRKKMTAVAAIAAAFVAAPAYAVSFGDTVTCSSNSIITCANSLATVTPGIEFQINNADGPSKTVDFEPGRLTFTSLITSSLSLTVFTFSDLTNPITSASLMSNMGWSGLDASDVSLDAGVLRLNLAGTSFSAGSYFTVSLGAASSAVPETATWAMMMVGLGVVGASLRHRRRQSSTRVSFI